MDSIEYYADFIAKEATRLNFNKGDVYRFVVKGIMKTEIMI